MSRILSSPLVPIEKVFFFPRSCTLTSFRRPRSFFLCPPFFYEDRATDDPETRPCRMGFYVVLPFIRLSAVLPTRAPGPVGSSF